MSVEVQCPACRTITHIDDVRDATEFCQAPGSGPSGRCDFPLFFARSTVGVAESSVLTVDEGDGRLRRPGTNGVISATAFPCPVCEERNDPAAVYCVRCLALLRPGPPQPLPPPPIEPEADPEPVVVVEVLPPPPPPPPARSWWLSLILIELILGVIVIAISIALH